MKEFRFYFYCYRVNDSWIDVNLLQTLQNVTSFKNDAITTPLGVEKHRTKTTLDVCWALKKRIQTYQKLDNTLGKTNVAKRSETVLCPQETGMDRKNRKTPKPRAPIRPPNAPYPTRFVTWCPTRFQVTLRTDESERRPSPFGG